MQFGVCGNFTLAAVAAGASYDYAEWGVTQLLAPLQPEAAFRALVENARTAELRYPAANGFIPGELKITGPEVDWTALETYVATTMERAERAGIETIVFGSGSARRIPQGFDPRKAHDQLVKFCRLAGPMAEDHGVTVAIEPLNKAECNVLTTVGECADLAREVGHPAIRLLVDAYHLMKDGDSYEDIVRHGDLLAHAHIATVPNRLAPGAEPCDCADFFAALAKAGYSGRISIEGNLREPETVLAPALAVMRGLAAGG